MKEGQNCNYEKKVPIKLQRAHQLKRKEKKRKEQRKTDRERAADFGKNQ